MILLVARHKRSHAHGCFIWDSEPARASAASPAPLLAKPSQVKVQIKSKSKSNQIKQIKAQIKSNKPNKSNQNGTSRGRRETTDLPIAGLASSYVNKSDGFLYFTYCDYSYLSAKHQQKYTLQQRYAQAKYGLENEVETKLPVVLEQIQTEGQLAQTDTHVYSLIMIRNFFQRL